MIAKEKTIVFLKIIFSVAVIAEFINYQIVEFTNSKLQLFIIVVRDKIEIRVVIWPPFVIFVVTTP